MKNVNPFIAFPGRTGAFRYGLIILSGLFPLCWMASCSTVKQAYVDREQAGWEQTALPDKEPSQVLYAIGDCGEIPDDKIASLYSEMARDMAQAGSNSAVFYLGDNIYPAGLARKDDKDREEGEEILKAQLNIARDFPGRVFMVPGNHDWNHWSSGGRKAVQRQEEFVEGYLNRGNTYRPDDGCGTPDKVKLEGDVVLIFLDSQWWLHDQEEEKGMNKGCDVKSRAQYLEEFDDLLLQNKNKQIVVVMHHPLHSNGNHGGYFGADQHLFPLTQANHSLWIPMPVIGSIVPLYRKFSGSIQDLPHPLYQELIDRLAEITAPYEDIIFLAGHEHTLQYHEIANHHYIVSGSGSKTEYLRAGKTATYAREANGYSRISVYPDGQVWMEFFVPDKNGNHLDYRQQIVEPRPSTIDYVAEEPFEALPDSASAPAADRYDAGSFKRLFTGRQYREAWALSYTAPVLNLETDLGGLTPLKKGGGQASNSLRMETADGRQFALRSIDKDLTKALPEEIRDINLLNLLQDQVSAMHPYSALVVPPLADAVGVYHTNPKVVYLKPQAAMGSFNPLFPEGLYLFEERPEGKRPEVPSFGKHEEIIGYVDLLDELEKDPNQRIDQEFVLRSRLFDMFIHDWDRHDDQWRWARMDGPDGTKIYRPIPRDRDQTFYRFEGLLPRVVSAFGIRKFATMKGDLKKPWWQGFNARYFDRYFLTEPDREEWADIAEEMQDQLTDSVIEAALHVWPDAFFEQDGEELLGLLKSRRDNLDRIAMRQYDYLSRAVSIPGTNQKDYFDVRRLDNGDTRVRLYERSGKGKKKNKRYDRTFVKSETNEIRLYGLEGDDEFVLKGRARKGIRIRIVGGVGDDEVQDESRVNGPVRHTIIYDAPEGVRVNKGPEVSNRTSDDIDVNEYDREDFQFDSGLPAAYVGFNVDDRIFIGGGYTWTKHNFRKDPYWRRHLLVGNYAPNTDAFNLRYIGDFVDAFRVMDFYLEAEIYNPYFINFFGLGNNTVNLDTVRQFNWVRINSASIRPFIKGRLGSDHWTLRGGPLAERYEVEEVEGRIAALPETGLPDRDFTSHYYLGGEVRLKFFSVDNLLMPEEGVVLETMANYRQRLDAVDEGFGQAAASLSFYLTFGRAVKLTLANRIGVKTNFGDDYPFFLANTVGGTEFLRGYRNDRFAGRTAFSHCNDLRLNFGKWNNKVLPMDIGLVGGFDYGRVWFPGDIEDEGSEQLYKGYAVGFFIAPFTSIALQPFMTWSKEEDWLFNFRMGFAF